MGEKRAYKARKPGGGRKKSKTQFDAGKNLKEQMDAAVALYEENCSLQSIADALVLNPIKVRKLLITASVYESEVAEKVQDIFEEYREAQSYKDAIRSTANNLQLSKASVTSYLPYKKGVYFPSTALPFSYKIKTGRNGELTKELWIDRRESSKSLTWSSVLLAFEKTEGKPLVERPKALGDIRGVAYIYGMFYRFGLIEVPVKQDEPRSDPTS